MKRHYHVVIAGAGPAGLSCAMNLINSGLKILLIDKSKHPGMKICAGGMRLSDISRMNIPEHMVWVKNNHIGMVTREDLYRFMISKIEGTHIDYYSGIKLTDIRDNTVTINKSEKITFQYLVGADGSNSMVRRHIGLKNGYSLYTMQYLLKDFDINRIVTDRNPTLFKCWYGWIFPHKDHAAVGCGAHSKIIRPGILKKNFIKWTRQFGIDVTRLTCLSHPINCDFRGYRFANIFLIGDAAGLADELTGEGIHQAIISGEQVAKMILDPNHSNQNLKQIVVQKLKQRGKIQAFEKQFS